MAWQRDFFGKWQIITPLAPSLLKLFFFKEREKNNFQRRKCHRWRQTGFPRDDHFDANTLSPSEKTYNVQSVHLRICASYLGNRLRRWVLSSQMICPERQPMREVHMPCILIGQAGHQLEPGPALRTAARLDRILSSKHRANIN